MKTPYIEPSIYSTACFYSDAAPESEPGEEHFLKSDEHDQLDPNIETEDPNSERGFLPNLQAF